MNESDFFRSLRQHYSQQLPFVVYAKNHQLKAYLQNDDALYSIKGFDQPGFVFCPFSEPDPKVIFPEEHAQLLSSKLNAATIQFSTPQFIENQTEKQNHIHLVSKAIETIKNTALQKIVCSRKITLEKQIDPIETFITLASQYSDAFCYCWYHPRVGLWLGATPEQFLNLERNILKTVALAGTINASEQPEPRWTAKEKKEQQLVVDFINQALKAHTDQVEIQDAQNIKAGNLWHLKSDIKAQIQAQDLPQIIYELHPTPAVCGLPQANAQEFILKNENYHRGYYSGFLGPLHFKQTTSRSKSRRNQEQQAIRSIKPVSDLYVNLRCMQVFDNSLEIYVGGGITKESQPEAEYAETLAKSQTLLNVI